MSRHRGGSPSRTVRTLRRQRLMPRVRPDLTRSVFSTILRIFGKLHGVTIRRELSNYDQINKSEHGETDRLLFTRDHTPPVCLLSETTPGLAKHGGGWPRSHGAELLRRQRPMPCVRPEKLSSPIASNAVREARKLTRCHHPPRIKTFRSNK